MKRQLDPDTYKKFAEQHTFIKQMATGQFVQWAHKFYNNAYNDGEKAALEEIRSAPGAPVFSQEQEAKVYEMDDIRQILLSVKGIGPRRAEEVIRILEGEP